MTELPSRLVAFDGLLPGLPSTNKPGLACRWSGLAEVGISACSERRRKNRIEHSRFKTQ